MKNSVEKEPIEAKKITKKKTSKNRLFIPSH